MDGMTLPPDLEQFAADAVAAGRYRDVGEVVAAGVALLKQRDSDRSALLRSVLEAQAEGDRLGYLTGDEVAVHVRQTIARKAGSAT